MLPHQCCHTNASTLMLPHQCCHTNASTLMLPHHCHTNAATHVQVMGFNAEMVATFIAAVGILSVVAQTAVLALLMRNLTCKRVIIVGLVFEMLQLMWYGFGSQTWMMWAAGLLAAMSSITYPAISAYVSMHTDVDKQGVVQGIVTGVRGLCSGLGPAMFGFIFYIFHVDLSETPSQRRNSSPVSSHPRVVQLVLRWCNWCSDGATGAQMVQLVPRWCSWCPGGAVGAQVVQLVLKCCYEQVLQVMSTNVSVVREMSVGPNLMPGPPFVFGALMVITALLVAAFIPEGSSSTAALAAKSRRQSGGSSLDLSYDRGHKGSGLDAASLPLMDESGAL
ncbi:Major facilitator superfamily associated domain [Trinorchestia longiramus]|nr:Major facilitator superfamily associated domain [Trinorchestia longiramus]